MSAAVYAYPWTFHELDSDVARIRALGVEEVTLAASYHAGKFIQPGDRARRVFFPEDGAIYFRPHAAYGALRPLVSTQTKERDVLAELVARRELRVNAWMVLNHNSRLGFLHPQFVVRNCFDDPYYYSLCPSQPEVRRYAVTLARDVAASYDVASLLLETPGFLAFAHGYHHEFAQVRPNARLNAMLGLCFCSACRSGGESAGIDMAGLAARIAVAVDATIAADIDPAVAAARIKEWNRADMDLARLHEWRASTVASLIAEIRAAVRPDVRVKVIATTQGPHRTTYLEGGDLPRMDAASDGLELPLYRPTPAQIVADAKYALKRVPVARTSVILRPGHPDMSDERSFQQALGALRALGIADFAFYNLSLLPEANIRWIANALNIPSGKLTPPSPG